MTITLIVAMDAARGIGIQNRLPWHLPQDLAHFKRQTTGHPIIMGRKTFDSIGRALPKRRNIVITRNPNWQAEGVESVTSLADALQLVGDAQAFVIGGAEIYALALPRADRLLVTEIAQRFDCDAFFPALEPGIWQESARETQRAAFDDGGFEYAFVEYQRMPKD
jgi:dihydrofolate reductase